jgi:hypothetical protein
MKRPAPAYVVYAPPSGFPFLSVILAPYGSVIARRFDTHKEASAYNSQMAKSGYPGGVKH